MATGSRKRPSGGTNTWVSRVTWVCSQAGGKQVDPAAAKDQKTRVLALRLRESRELTVSFLGSWMSVSLWFDAWGDDEVQYVGVCFDYWIFLLKLDFLNSILNERERVLFCNDC